MVKINIVKEFSDTPGGRYSSEGSFSGESFRNELLEPRFKEALEKNEKLIIEMDGSFGYPPSFIEESFGGLIRITKEKKALEVIEIISEDEPSLKEEINDIIRKELQIIDEKK